MAQNLFYLILRVANVFGVVPWINFPKKQINYSTFAKIYPPAVGCATFLFILPPLITDAFSLLNLWFSIVVIIMVLLNTNFNRKQWRKWIEIYEMVKKDIKLELNESLEIDWTSIAIILPYFMSVSVIILLICIKYSVNYRETTNFLVYVRLVAEILPILFSKILLKGFKSLNKYCSRYLPFNAFIETDGQILVLNADGIDAGFCKKFYKNLFDLSVYVLQRNFWMAHS